MNDVERAGERWLSDHRDRSIELCTAAEAAVLKGDLELAERLLIQADVDDPRNPFPEERYISLASEIKKLEASKPTADPGGRKFDFLYTPTLRGLSTELSTLLPLHPELFSVPKHELDRAIEGHQEPALLAKYQRQVLSGHKELRAGLVQHAYISGQRAGPEVAERLAGITTRKLFLHGVRDPVRLAISDFNHELIARHGGAYVFWSVYPKSPFCWAVYRLGNGLTYERVRATESRKAHWRERIREMLTYDRLRTEESREAYWRERIDYHRQGKRNPTERGLASEWMFRHGLSRFSLDAALIAERFDDAVTRPKHFAVGQTYAQHFDSWIPIDLERPAATQESVIGRVFAAIGVDSGFDHPALHASEGTTVHRLMVQNWIWLEAFDHLIPVGLGYANRTMFSNTFAFSELLAFEPDERFAALGLKGHPLCLTVRRDQWLTLPRDVRVRLVESKELLKFRDTVFIPAWLDSHARWMSIMRKYLLRELNRPQLARLRAHIGPDLESFLKRHPQFEHVWRSTRALFGDNPHRH